MAEADADDARVRLLRNWVRYTAHADFIVATRSGTRTPTPQRRGREVQRGPGRTPWPGARRTADVNAPARARTPPGHGQQITQ